MFKYIACLAVLSSLALTRLYPQTPSFYHYTSSDGLASSTVYHIIQDRNGFIWFGTINGMSKFDGKHFTTFRTIHGLNSNSIISLAEGEKGELYIANYEKGINVLRNGRIENYCSTINGKSFAAAYLVLVPSGKDEHTLYAYRGWGALNYITENTSGKLITGVIRPSADFINRVEALPNGEMLVLSTGGLFTLKNETFAKLPIPGLEKANVYCYAKGNDGSFLLGARGRIYRIKNNAIIKEYKVDRAGNNDVCAMLWDKNNNIWFSIMNKGFFVIPHGSDRIVDVGSKMGLQNTLVNNYLEDREGNIWISSFGKGVYCLNNLYLKSFNEHDGLTSNIVYAIAKEKAGGLLIGTFNGMNILENGRFAHFKSNSQNTLTDLIFHIINGGDTVYLCGAFGGNGTTNITYQGKRFGLFNGPSFCKTRGGLFLFGTGGNRIDVQRQFTDARHTPSQFYVFGDSSHVNRINEIFEDTERNIWIGTSLGLCKLSIIPDRSGKARWEKMFFNSNPVLSSKINSIIQDKKYNVWFAGENGIARYNLRNDSVSSYTMIMGNDLSSSTSLAFDIKNRLWIGNMKGLYLFDGSSIKYLNRKTGLQSDEVFSLYCDTLKNTLYAGTSNGISILDIDLFDAAIPPAITVKIVSIKAGDSVYTVDHNLTIDPDHYHVTIGFNAISFSSPGSVKYKYNMNGVWEETDHDYLDFIALKQGSYELQIMAKSQNAEWSKPVYLSFRVLPRFVETIWFDLLIIAIVALIAAFVTRNRFRVQNKRRKEELELTERINELKHQALSAMMNPHFIYNSLNSVQYLIGCQRNEDANDYIAMMAKLIRKNLDTAGNGFILLSEEISRLTLYLELEKLRFQDNFSYEIRTGTDVDTRSLLIPNMIIQPFVENTLWHGIINSGNKGFLTVSFSFENVDIDSVICTALIIKVNDNGIGINEAKKHKKEDHISKGIQIIEERLRLLSAKMELPPPIMFEDLSSRSGNSHGTEVTISLPPPLYKIAAPDASSVITG